MGSLYTFADLMGTWTAVFTFGFIVAAIYGGIKNRKTKKVITDQKSYFVPMAIISLIIVGLALAITILIPIIDLLLIAQLDSSIPTFTNVVISRVTIFICLLLYIFFSYGIVLCENKYLIKKYGSIEEYEKWQNKNFNVF